MEQNSPEQTSIYKIILFMVKETISISKEKLGYSIHVPEELDNLVSCYFALHLFSII